MLQSLSKSLAAEFLGSLLLLTAIVGSGIMAENLSGSNAAIALLANSLATGAMFTTLIITFGSLSGAHFNPLVSGAAAVARTISWQRLLGYVAVQFSGALAGVAIANAMFDHRLLETATQTRSGIGPWLGEIVATFGLIGIIEASAKRPAVVPITVGAYITAAYWFTSSTSFANPAVTLARSLTDSFTGIRFADVVPFIACQSLGCALAIPLFRWMLRPPKE